MPKDYSQPQSSKKAVRKFTDRESYIEAFWSKLNALDPLKQSVLYFHGVGGIGKTALLAELRRLLRSLPHHNDLPTPLKQFAYGEVDFQNNEHRNRVSALLQLRSTLAKNGEIRFPTFDIAYAHYYQKTFPGQATSKELATILDRLNTGQVSGATITAIVEEIPILNKVWKASNLASKTAEFKKRQIQLQKSQELRVFLLHQEPIKMLDRLVDFFTADLRAAYEPDRPIVLFMDTLEALQSHSQGIYSGAKVDKWVMHLAGELPGILIIMAGRRRLDWEELDNDWKERNLLKQHLVGKLAKEDAIQFLSTAEIPPSIQEVILSHYEGLPFFLDLAVDLYEQSLQKREAEEITKSNFAGSISEITNRLLSYLDDNQRAAVRVLSAPRSFDFELFKELMQHFGTGYPIDKESYQALLKFSLFAQEEESAYVHELVREFIGGDTQNDVRAYLLKTIEQTLIDTDIKQVTPDLADLLEEGFHQAQQLKGELEGINWFYYNVGIFEMAGLDGLLFFLYQKALAQRIEILGEKHPDTITSVNNLASCFNALGNASEALPLYQKALAQRTEIFGEKHPATIRSLNNLAYCLEMQGHAITALPLYQKALEQRIEILGEKHPTTINSLNNFAACLDTLGRSAEALPLYQRALEQRLEILGEEHSDTINSLNNLAYCFNRLGHYNKALPLYQKVLRQSTEILGENHPGTINAVNNLAYCLNLLGRSEEALPLYQKALAQHVKILGEKHPATIRSVNNLAYCINMLGRSEEALPLYRKALQQRTEVLGEKHPETITSLNNLAYCLNTLGRSEEALPLYQKALKQRTEVLGEKHPNTINSVNNLASCLGVMGRSEEALPLYQNALEQSTKVLGEKHPSTINLVNNLATTLNKLGRSEEALLLYIKALKQNTEVLGAQHPSTISSANNLSDLVQQLEEENFDPVMLNQAKELLESRESES